MDTGSKDTNVYDRPLIIGSSHGRACASRNLLSNRRWPYKPSLTFTHAIRLSRGSVNRRWGLAYP